MKNGFSTTYFNLNRGTRQGDPLFPYLFIHCLEVLLVRIRNDVSVRGFKFDKIEIKLTSFANDVTFLAKDVSSIKRILKIIEIKLTPFADDVTFLAKDTSSIKRILKIMKTFGAFSSLKISVEKCEACWLGKSKGNTDKPIDCKWVPLKTKTIKLLVTHFSYNKELEEKMNFYNLPMDCRNVLAQSMEAKMAFASRKNSNF